MANSGNNCSRVKDGVTVSYSCIIGSRSILGIVLTTNTNTDTNTTVTITITLSILPT